MKTLYSSFLFGAMLVSAWTTRGADSILVHLGYNPGSQSALFTITWTSVAGQAYDVLATSDLLHQPWVALNSSPIVASGVSASFVDAEFRARRFYQVRQRTTAAGNEPPLSNSSILPAYATLAPGGTQRFRALLPAGATAVWRVYAFNGVNSGTITPVGVYTAPNEIPDPPFALVRGQSASDPAQSAEAIVQMVPAAELIITREQAIEILLRDVIEPLPGKTNLLALGLSEVIDASTKLTPHQPTRGGTVVSVPVSGPSWFFMLDENPLGSWAHSVNYVLINAQSSVVERNVVQQWHPEVDGEPLWDSAGRVDSLRDRVYIGSALAATLQTSIPAGTVQAKSTEVIPIHRVFPPVATACDIPLPARRYAVIGVMNPEEEPLAVSGNTWRDLFTANSFSTKLIPNGDPSAVLLELDRLRSVVRPSDVLVVFLLGHGVGGSVSKISSTVVSDALALIPTSGKYSILECCDAGWVFDIFKTQPLVPRVQILTASNIANPPDPFVGTSPLFVTRGDESGFTAVLLRCLSRYDTLAEVHDCLTTLFVAEPIPINPIALRMKLADPQLGFVGDADSDQDGLIDKLENELGTDPGNPDSDGDGVCDGVEFGQLANLEKRNDDGTRDISYSRGLRKARFTANATLPTATAAVSYTTTLGIVSGTPYGRNAVSQTNPFGTNSTPRWAVTRGTLPQGMVLDGFAGRLFGTPTVSGDFTFEVVYTDAIGAKTRRTFSLTVNLTQAGTKPEILITTTADGNVRDNDISLREAILLASGKLLLSQLRADPDPNNGISEGEVRWVSKGSPGAASRDLIRALISSGASLAVTGTLVIDGNDDDFQIPSDYKIVAGEGPALEITGNGNQFNSLVSVRVSGGPVLVIRGNFNGFGLSVPLTSRPSSEFLGGGTGDGVLVTGRNNSLFGLIIRGFSNGVHFTAGASENSIFRSRIVENGQGILIDAGANRNTVRECNVGFMFTDVAPPVAAPNSGAGIVITGGASSNLVVDSGIGGNGDAGILIQGPGTDANEILSSRIGSMQGSFSTRGEAGPNKRNGLVIAGGAQQNRASSLEITSNTGHGILLTDPGTRLNEIGARETDWVIINKPDDSGDGVHIEKGASFNTISVRVDRSGGSGVAIAGSGTVSNRVTHRLLGGVYYPTIITNTIAPGVVIQDGASGNVVEAARVFYSPIGVLISGAGTRDNVLSGVSLEKNAVAAVRMENGAQGNRLTGNSLLQGNKTGVVLAGEGTRLNILENLAFGFLTPNENYGIELREGAQENIVTGVNVQLQRLGGILIDGAQTRANRIEKSRLSGGLSAADIAASGTAVTLQNGATANLVTDNTIQNNGGNGVLISGATTSSNRVMGNTFTANQLEAVRILGAPNNYVGSSSGRGNSIFNHTNAAIRIGGAGATGNRVLGNQIGSANAASANASHGILLELGADRSVIGGVLPQTRDARLPQILLKPNPTERGGGNWIIGNGGDGIRLTGANSNRISGNLIGYSNPLNSGYGNAGHGIALLDGSRGNQIGNALPPNRRNPGYGNHLAQNRGAGIFLSGSATTGNKILQNGVYANTQVGITLVQGANGSVRPPDASIDVPSAQISGVAPASSYIELFSSRADDRGIYHLTAFVRRGEYIIDQLHPERSINASIIESDRPIRYGTQTLTFTDAATGNTSISLEFNVDGL